MAENIIHGEFEYNGKTYPFVIQNRVLTVVQSAFHYLEDFRGKEELGTLVGVTDTNKYILLLDCRVWNPRFITLSGRLQIALHGYILQDIRDVPYQQEETLLVEAAGRPGAVGRKMTELLIQDRCSIDYVRLH